MWYSILLSGTRPAPALALAAGLEQPLCPPPQLPARSSAREESLLADDDDDDDREPGEPTPVDADGSAAKGWCWGVQ